MVRQKDIIYTYRERERESAMKKRLSEEKRGDKALKKILSS